MSRQLASVVVPHEYGLDGPGKLLIGSKICAELLGKLMCDLDSMKVGGEISIAVMLGAVRHALHEAQSRQQVSV